jgi:hypothetical protein
MSKSKMTAAEIRAYRELARAARKLRRAQERAARRQADSGKAVPHAK